MRKIKFLEDPKEEENMGKKMFPQLFPLSYDELLKIKGGIMADKDKPCDAVCGREWGCSCHTNLA